MNYFLWNSSHVISAVPQGICAYRDYVSELSRESHHRFFIVHRRHTRVSALVFAKACLTD